MDNGHEAGGIGFSCWWMKDRKFRQYASPYRRLTDLVMVCGLSSVVFTRNLTKRQDTLLHACMLGAHAHACMCAKRQQHTSGFTVPACTHDPRPSGLGHA